MRTVNLRDHAHAFDLPPLLVYGIVQVESGGDPDAFRAEPAYRYLYDVEKDGPFRALSGEEIATAKAPPDFPHLALCSRHSEWFGQQSSWGPMQIMGAVAREEGFEGPFPQLCSLDDGVHWGCHHLRSLADRYQDKDGWTGVISAYNQGSPRRHDNGLFCNQDYVNRVILAMQQLADDARILNELHNESPA